MTIQPDIHIHNTNFDSGAHIWRVLATFLAIGSLVSLAYGLTQWGLIEIAATGTSAVLAMLFQLMIRNGFIVFGDGPSEDARIEEGRNALKAIAGMIQAYIDHSSLLRLVLISIGYGVAFVLLRQTVTWALTVFTNIWMALAAGGVIAAFICFPTLFAGLLRAVRSRTHRTGAPTAAPAAAEPVTGARPVPPLPVDHFNDLDQRPRARPRSLEVQGPEGVE
ncbi:hypothetical protein DEO23_15630 [Brachybacterium endophyticum]|uniref:Uncharacterized protein n=1 Tax=Brachybacterium endophyticum TaxID=2182385 RepID=A0A2U2RGH0_9MICO|nr:hypothetical protein [Brachybacterium endophyticum]PWH04962.1 hypothetical protein DEO23_15630 [Brachybacterium endophyticum]